MFATNSQNAHLLCEFGGLQHGGGNPFRSICEIPIPVAI